MRSDSLKIFRLWVTGILISLIVIICLFNMPFVIIGAGERGVVFNQTTGIEDRVLGEGIHFRMPFIQKVKVISIRVQKNDINATAASKDLQTVTADVAVNWHINPEQVHRVYQNIGNDDVVVAKIITPHVNEVVKAATALKTAEETLTKRGELKDAIDLALTERLAQYNLIVDDVSLVNISFSDEFDKAIERKAQAEQDALAEKNKLEQVKYQAQQKIETAKAEAESIRIRAEALKQNQELVQLNAVEKWNGVLPTYVGSGSIPFIQLPNK